jgi:hypothetical protein
MDTIQALKVEIIVQESFDVVIRENNTAVLWTRYGRQRLKGCKRDVGRCVEERLLRDSIKERILRRRKRRLRWYSAEFEGRL